MGKRVLIISSTPRVNGNSYILAKSFAKGAEDSGNEVEIINLRENKIDYCIGCYSCRKFGKCFQNDGMNTINEKLLEADVIVFASPIYMYDVCGQLKTFIDRILPIYKQLKSKEFYYIASCAENDKEAIEPSIKTIYGLLDNLENPVLKGVIYGIDLHKTGEAEESLAKEEAYLLGKNI